MNAISAQTDEMQSHFSQQLHNVQMAFQQKMQQQQAEADRDMYSAAADVDKLRTKLEIWESENYEVCVLLVVGIKLECKFGKGLPRNC